MALPIHSTPTLSGNAAKIFIQNFEAVQTKCKNKQPSDIDKVKVAKVKDNIKKSLHGKK